MAVAVTAAVDQPGAAMKLRPPSRLRLVDDVSHSLEDAILAGRMRPGERLVETRLCQELGVSRTTLREALLMLQRRGLVRGEPRRGTFVTRLSRHESRDLCLARALLESYAVNSGYDRLDEATFVRLDGLLDQMAACRLPEETPVLIAVDRAFHGLLMRCTDSARVRELWAGLDGQMSALILSSLEHHHAGAADVAEFHRALVHALRTGDPAVARDAVIAHYLGNDDEDGAPDASTLAGIAEVIEALANRAGRRQSSPMLKDTEKGRPETREGRT
jgi:DNA-binding GntR family transcriptional regulator